MIAIVDRIEVRGPDAAAVRDRYLAAYAPLARRRGMTLCHALMSPPVALREGANILTFVWTVPDLPAWWRMRLAGARDPNVAAFWRGLDADIVSRTRTHNAVVPLDA